MFRNEDAKHFWEVVKGALQTLPVYHIEVLFVYYVLFMQEFLRGGRAPVFVDGGPKRASNALAVRLHRELFEGENVIDEFPS